MIKESKDKSRVNTKNLKIKESTHKKLKLWCVENEQQINEAASQIIEDWIIAERIKQQHRQESGGINKPGQPASLATEQETK